jgi:hypothetical protein
VALAVIICWLIFVINFGITYRTLMGQKSIIVAAKFFFWDKCYVGFVDASKIQVIMIKDSNSSI